MTSPPGDDPLDAPAADAAAIGAAEAVPPDEDERAALAAPPVLDAPVAVVTSVVGLAFLMYLLIEPTPAWVALVAAGAAAVGTERALRLARARSVELGLDPTPQIALPALYALAMPVFAEEMARGWWAVVAALGLAAGFGAILAAQTHSLRPRGRRLALARPVSAAGVYVTAFALFATSYLFDLALVAAVAAAACGAGLLAIELLRDGQADLPDTVGLGVVVALVVGQLRWTLHFLPLDGYAAALALLLAFFLACGLLHAHLTLQLRRAVVAQYAVIAMLGGAIIIGARTAGLA